MNRPAILISEDEELYKSFKRAIKTVYDVEISNFKKSLENEEIAVIFDNIGKNNRDFESWFCGFFRKKLRNPLIVMGAEEEESFIQRYPVFRDYSYNHAYIPIPFKLQQFIDIVFNIKPIYDDDTRMFIVNDYCKNYEYSLVTHELKIISKDKETTLNNFAIVRDFYKGVGNKNKVKFIDEIMKKIKENDDWLNISIETKQTLVNDIEKGKANG